MPSIFCPVEILCKQLSKRVLSKRIIGGTLITVES